MSASITKYAPARALHLKFEPLAAASALGASPPPRAPLPPVLSRAARQLEPSVDELVYGTQERLRQRYAQVCKRRRREGARHPAAIERESLRQDDQKAWLQRRGMQRRFSFTLAQKRMLRGWFESIDVDGSGNITVSELEEALVSTGVCSDAAQVADIFSRVDHDGSGEIGFSEFLEVLMPRGTEDEGRAAPTSLVAARALATLKRRVDKAQAVGLSVDVVVNTSRRRLLMQAITDGLEHDAREDETIWHLSAEAAAAMRAKDAHAPAMLDALGQRRAARDRSRIRRRKYVHVLAGVVKRGTERQRHMDVEQQQTGHKRAGKQLAAATHGAGEKLCLPAIARTAGPEALKEKEKARERRAALRRIRARKRDTKQYKNGQA